MEQTSTDHAVISVKNLGKCYRIYDRPKDRLKQAFWRARRQYFREFWALRNVSFEVARGETLGIIGRNGSGKSTLLQMLCGTLSPSEGQLETRGKIAALLELGSGFNPEFTGIENVYLNASLLGLRKQQVQERLDDILAFADIGDFVNQPVKAYSSGMAVRLAFAVMAHVDADILVVDEALSVGDAFFTQKCMRFIHRFRQQGSLLFVSHDTTAVTSICDKAILLNGGRISRIGSAKAITEEYVKDAYESELSQLPASRSAARNPGELVEGTGSAEAAAGSESGAAESGRSPRRGEAPAPAEHWIDYRKDRINNSTLANVLEITQFPEALLTSESFGDGRATLSSVTLREVASGQPLLVGLGGEQVQLRIEGKAHETIKQPIIGFILKNERGVVLLGDNTNNMFDQHPPGAVQAGTTYAATFNFTLPLLPEGSYSVTASLADGTQNEHSQLHWVNDALLFRSSCTSVAAGLAGVAMQAIRFETTL